MENRVLDQTLIFKKSITPILDVIASDGAKVSRPINTECVIVGRSKQADISVDDDKLSRNHFMVVRSEGKFEVKDLNSSNGLIVNGKKTRHTILTGNDKIKAGGTTFHFTLSRDDLKKDEILRSEPSFSDGMFEKKYSPVKRGVLGRKILLTSLSISLLAFAITLGVLSLEKDAKVAPSIKKDRTFQEMASVEKEVSALKISEDEKLKAINYFRVAEHHFNLKNWDLAKKTMETYFAIVPNSTLAPAFIAVCDEAMNRTATVEDKIDDIQKAADKRELIAKLLRDATQELNKQNFDEANAIFLKVISLDEYNQEAYDGLITIDRELVRIQKEQEEQPIVAPLNEGDAFAKQMEVLFKKGNYTKSFEIAVRIATMGKEKAGDAAFSKAIRTQMNIRSKINKVYANTINEAEILVKANASDEAIKLYKKVLAMFPYHDGAKAGLTRIMKQRHEQAKELYARALIENSYPQESKAAEKFRAILTLVPSTDQYYQKAKRALQKKNS